MAVRVIVSRFKSGMPLSILARLLPEAGPTRARIYGVVTPAGARCEETIDHDRINGFVHGLLR